MVTIQSIELRNFMCHRSLLINFTKPVTIISGLNGSGKSAVMVAIGALFNQRAAQLDRGRSYAEFIKEGCTEAIVKVKMKNFRKFHYDHFGDTIVIERRFAVKTASKTPNDKRKDADNGSKTCSSTLIISNESGRVWSRKIKDLQSLMLNLMLQFDNPVNFLTQEHAKRFLSVSGPESLYKLFMKGTNFTETNEIHTKCFEEILSMLQKINSLESESENLNIRIAHNNDLLKSQQNLQTLKDQLASLKLERKWSVLNFKTLLELHAKVSLGSLNDQLIKNKLDLEHKINDLEMDLTAKSEDLRHLRSENSVKADEIQLQIDAENTQIRELSNDLEEISKCIVFTTKKLDDIEKLKMRDETVPLAKTIDELTLDIKNSKSSKELLCTELDAKYAEYKNRSEQINLIKSEISNLNNQIADSKRLSANRMLSYGRNFQLLDRDVKNSQFSDSVIGPIGEYVRLKDHKWFKPISRIFHKYLSSYIVFNMKDAQKLRILVKQHNVNVQILTPAQKSTDRIRVKSPQYLTAMNVVEISNVFVFNQLVTLTSFESIILFEDRKKAYDVLKTKPAHVECAFTISGDVIRYNSGLLTDFSHTDNINYFFQSYDNKLSHLEGKLAETKRKNMFNEFQEDYNTIKTKYFALEGHIDHKTHALNEQKLKYDKLIQLKNSIFNEDEQLLQDELNVNRSQSLQLEDLIKESQTNIKRLFKDIDVLKKQVIVKQNEYRAVKEQKLMIETDLRKINYEIDKNEQNFSASKSQYELYKRNLESDIDELMRETDKVLGKDVENTNFNLSSLSQESEKRKTIQNITLGHVKEDSLITQISENSNLYTYSQITTLRNIFQNQRIPHQIRPKNLIDSEISVLVDKIESQKMEKPRYIIQKELTADIKNLQTIKNKISISKTNIEKLETRAKNRMQKATEIKMRESELAAERFSKFLKIRNYTGKLIFDHEKSTLEIKIKILGNKKGGDKNTLSGGERSFSSVCLLLSLWPSVSCPVKILDEFDVFMDSSNRKGAIELIFQYLKMYRNVDQVILISPLDANMADENCDVIVLEPPVRNNPPLNNNEEV